MSEYTEDQRQLAAAFGFTPEEVDAILGPSYLEAHRQAKEQYEETQQRLIHRAESLGMQVRDARDCKPGDYRSDE